MVKLGQTQQAANNRF